MNIDRVPLRFSDLDGWGHVNNVRYLAFADEARDRIGPDQSVFGPEPVRRSEVTYLQPMMPEHEVAVITTERTEAGVVQEIYGETVEGGPLCVRILHSSSPPESSIEVPATSRNIRIATRRGEATDGYISQTVQFELFQEARIQYFAQITSPEPGFGFVVAQTNVNFRAPLPGRDEPYDIVTWIHHVGRSSVVIAAEIRDGDTCYAEMLAVQVKFDAKTQKSQPLLDNELALLRRAS